MKRIAIMLMFSALILFALEFKTTEHVKAEDDDWIVYMTNDLDSLQRDSIGNIVTDRIRDSIAALEHRTLDDLDSASIALRLASRDSAEQVWKDSTGQAIVVIPNDLTVHGEISVDDTLHIDGFRLHGDGDYLSFYGRDGGAQYQYYFENGGISTDHDFELNGSDLNMNAVGGDGNLNLGYNSATGASDTLRWGTVTGTIVGKIFQKLIDRRPYLMIENTGIRLNSTSGETWVADSLQVDGYIYGGDNAHIDGTLEIGDNNRYIELIHDDTLAVSVPVWKSLGKFASMLGYYINNGFSIVPTSATETTLSGSDKVYVRADFVPNRFFSTSPTSTVIGEGAGKEGMSGGFNVVVGYSSGSSLSGGVFNTMSGVESGMSITSGSHNTIFGYRAGRAITTNTRNSMFGSQSGYSTTGEKNTFIGMESGYANTSGASNVYLGNEAGKTATATQSNKLIIANSATNNLITGDFSTGIATINNVLTLTPITTANRPATPAEGMMYMDSTVDSLKIYINSKWFNINMTEE
jgi:hypothetical protein